MSIGKVVRNAGSHRILYALSFGVKGSKELKLVVGAINSISRFDGEYMQRLVGSGYVRRVTRGWAITKAGQEKLEELGPVHGLNPESRSFKDTIMKAPVYNPNTKPAPLRPGSEDFLKYPSRIGKRLHYRDGTVKEIKNGY